MKYVKINHNCVIIKRAKLITFAVTILLQSKSYLMMRTSEIKEKMISKFRILRTQSETLPENERIYAEGKNKAGFEKLQLRLGKSQEEMHRIIAALNTSL